MINYKSRQTISIFGVIFLFVFLIVYFGYLRTGSFFDFTFLSLIEYLSDMPTLTLDELINGVDLTIVGNWGIFDFFRSFLNTITSIIEVGLIVCGLIGNLFICLVYLLGLFFI